LRPLHDEISTAALEHHTGLGSRRDQYVTHPTADRMRHRHVRDTPLSKKALLPREGAVDELIDDDKIAGHEVLAQAANGRERHDVGYAAALQRIDIGAKVDLGGRQHVTPPVARHEYDRLAIEQSETELVGGPAERAFDSPPLDRREPVDLVEPAASDDADDGTCHPPFSG